MKIRSIAGCWLILFCFFLLSTPQAGRAQKVENQEIFSPKEMNKRWETFSTDKAFQVLLKEVRAKGFTRKKDPKASWGFKGTAVSEKGEKDDALFCIFDLEKKGSKETCSMIWGRKGKIAYKAYLVIPEGKGLENANEWYVDEKNTVQKANSWKTCVLRELPRICGPFCAGAVPACAVAAGATIGATGGIGAITSPGVFLGCLAAACGGCVGFISLLCLG